VSEVLGAIDTQALTVVPHWTPVRRTVEAGCA
jgi:hypothetical protein